MGASFEEVEIIFLLTCRTMNPELPKQLLLVIHMKFMEKVRVLV